MSLTGVDSHEYIIGGGGAAIVLDMAGLAQDVVFHFIHMCVRLVKVKWCHLRAKWAVAPNDIYGYTVCTTHRD